MVARNALSWGVIFLVLGVAGPAAAATVVVLDQDRFVEANADAAAGGQTGFEIADHVASGTGPFVASEDADATVQGASADASSDQISMLDPMGFEAMGRTDASALGAARDASAAASSISFFEVSFLVEETGRFLLEGAIDAFANAAGDAMAEVSLTAPDLALSLFFRAVDGIGLEQFSEFVTLTPGVEYVLTAFSTADALAGGAASLSSGISGYDVGLTMVPEPQRILLVAAMVLWIAAPHRRTGERRS